METLVIAEAGVNHNGSLRMALEMVRAAKAADADVIKFQTFRADSIVVPDAPKAQYQKEADKSASQYEMLRRLELSHDDFRKIIDECRRVGIEFMSTPFSVDDARFLASTDMCRWKIASGEITNRPLLEYVASTGRPVIMSTGMCTMSEVETAVNVLVSAGLPLSKIYLLHCTTAYPCPPECVNLLAMNDLRRFGVAGVGYSDHTQGTAVAVAAVALGAGVIEKHFTLDRMLEGPDHRASITPDELSRMVEEIHTVCKALGRADKEPAAAELCNSAVARKSIVASRAIRKGDVFTANNLTAKRPGTGLSPMEWHNLVGRTAQRDYDPNQQISINELKSE